MQLPRITYLKWDSSFFSKKIGRIIFSNSTVADLEDNLKLAKHEKYDLIYVFENADDKTTLLENYKPKLVDTKIILAKQVQQELETNCLIQDVTYSKSNETIDALAISSGLYSRFNLDKGFSSKDFHNLYKIWIRNSLNRDIADKVFINADDKIKGLITIRITQGIGVIGLVSVSELAQGQGVGGCLVNACNNFLFLNNIKKMEVATQAANLRALGFYKNNGFKMQTCTNIYHFWL
ncbi:MAG: GNAT family N-acetyltransferase [Bacteroidales bacterium]|nr:GNAT family N-acetyltransferase [Bacteroidales bacterium]